MWLQWSILENWIMHCSTIFLKNVKTVKKRNPAILMKAVKNPVEIENIPQSTDQRQCCACKIHEMAERKCRQDEDHRDECLWQTGWVPCWDGKLHPSKLRANLFIWRAWCNRTLHIFSGDRCRVKRKDSYSLTEYRSWILWRFHRCNQNLRTRRSSADHERSLHTGCDLVTLQLGSAKIPGRFYRYDSWHPCKKNHSGTET